jgi:hypothetical protein
MHKCIFISPHCKRSAFPTLVFTKLTNTDSTLMFCWPYIIVYQYSETNVMHFLFNLLRIKGFYMFRALLAHPQEVLNKRYLVYCLRVMSVGCTILVQPRAVTEPTFTKVKHVWQILVKNSKEFLTNAARCIRWCWDTERPKEGHQDGMAWPSEELPFVSS